MLHPFTGSTSPCAPVAPTPSVSDNPIPEMEREFSRRSRPPRGGGLRGAEPSECSSPMRPERADNPWASSISREHRASIDSAHACAAPPLESVERASARASAAGSTLNGTSNRLQADRSGTPGACDVPSRVVHPLRTAANTATVRITGRSRTSLHETQRLNSLAHVDKRSLFASDASIVNMHSPKRAPDHKVTAGTSPMPTHAVSDDLDSRYGLHMLLRCAAAHGSERTSSTLAHVFVRWRTASSASSAVIPLSGEARNSVFPKNARPKRVSHHAERCASMRER